MRAMFSVRTVMTVVGCVAIGLVVAPSSAVGAMLQQVFVTNDAAHPVPVAGAVSVNNLPSTQAVSGSVSVGNLPATQPVSGSVSVSNLPSTQPVSGSVNVSNLPVTQAVSGTVHVAEPTPFVGEAHGSNPGFGIADTGFVASANVMVDTASVQVQEAAGGEKPMVDLICNYLNGTRQFYVPMQLANSSSSGYDYYVGTLTNLHLPCDSGTLFGRAGSGTSISINLSVTGHNL
ncbi:MAG: hypothetical protein NVS3B26_22920 [Mycobacteriales bacterium]